MAGRIVERIPFGLDYLLRNRVDLRPERYLLDTFLPKKLLFGLNSLMVLVKLLISIAFVGGIKSIL